MNGLVSRVYDILFSSLRSVRWWPISLCIDSFVFMCFVFFSYSIIVILL